MRDTLIRATPGRVRAENEPPAADPGRRRHRAAAVHPVRAAADPEPVLHRHDDPGGRVLDGHARPRRPGRPGRPGLPGPGRGARDRRLGGRPAAVRHHPALPADPARGGPDHDGGGRAHRAARAPAARPVPGADHADVRGRDHRRAGHGELPERRPRLHRLQRRPAAHPADPQAQHRVERPGLLPLLGHRRDRDVPAGPGPHENQTRPGLGGDPAERGGRAGRGHQHHAVQALGLRPGLVHHRRGRRRAGRRGALPVLDRLPHPGLDHPAGRDADGRRLQHVGRGDSRAAVPVPARPAEQLGRLGRLADHLVRPGRAPGADHRPGRPGRPGTQGPGPPGPPAAQPTPQSPRRGARNDRGQRPDRPLRRRHLAGRHEPDLRAGYVRAHRAERRGQDHLLQRA